jgi:hypothetical protein
MHLPNEFHRFSRLAMVTARKIQVELAAPLQAAVVFAGLATRYSGFSRLRGSPLPSRALYGIRIPDDYLFAFPGFTGPSHLTRQNQPGLPNKALGN